MITGVLITSLLLLAPGPVALGTGHTVLAVPQGPNEERIVRTLQVSDGDVLELHNISGDVTVTGTSGHELHIEAVKRARRGGRSALDAVDAEIQQRGGRVEVRTRARRGRTHASVDYTVRVPASMVLDIHNVSGNLRVSQVNGRATLQAVSGGIVADALEQLVAVQTVSGDVEISSSAGSRDASISSVSGNITLTDVTVSAVKINSTSGGVRLANVSADRLEVTALSGDIAFAGPLSPSGRYTLATHSGNVRFQPDGAAGFALDAGSFSGSIDTDFPITMTGGATAPGRRRVQGTVGDGAASVELTTFSGNINLVK